MCDVISLPVTIKGSLHSVEVYDGSEFSPQIQFKLSQTGEKIHTRNLQAVNERFHLNWHVTIASDGFYWANPVSAERKKQPEEKARASK